jgi:hypothetical protein
MCRLTSVQVTGSLDFAEFEFVTHFFCGEGPHRRRYGRTTALRLIVQPCDEGDDDDDYFCPFPSNGAPVE